MKNGKFALIAAMLSLYAFGDGRVTETAWYGAYDSGSYSDEGFVAKVWNSFANKTYYWCCKDCGDGIEVTGFDVNENWDGSYVPCVYTGTWDGWPDSSHYVDCAYLHSAIVPYYVNGKPLVKIGVYAFIDCGFDSIDIPGSVTTIDTRAFFRCKKLLGLRLPDGLKKIGKEAFARCADMQEINIPSTVTELGVGAFDGCSKLNAVDFTGAPPIGVESACINRDAVIRYNAKYAADWLTVIAQCGWTDAKPSDGGPYTETVDGIDWTFKVLGGCAEIRSGKSDKPAIPSGVAGEIMIPSFLGGCPVTVIGDYAFRGCGSITSVSVPEGVTTIGDYAFFNCGLLSSLKLPSTVKSIGEYAFSYCREMADFVMPKGVASIGKSAFLECNSLMELELPSSLMSLGEGAFSNCSGLTMVLLPSGLKEINWSLFRGCESLTSVTIPTGVESIGGLAFRGCVGLVRQAKLG